MLLLLLLLGCIIFLLWCCVRGRHGLYGCDGLVVVAALRRSVPPSLQRKRHEVRTRDELLVADAQVVERIVKLGWLRMGELLMVSLNDGLFDRILSRRMARTSRFLHSC